MTDIPIPPVSPATPATPARGLLDAPRDGTVESLPKSLLGGDRAVKVRGEVQGRNEDGSTRINTPRGPVNVRIQGDQLPRGTRVEVEIPPGNPPAAARVRAEAPPQPQPPQPQPQQTQTPQSQAPQPRLDTPPQQGQPAPRPGPAPAPAPASAQGQPQAAPPQTTPQAPQQMPPSTNAASSQSLPSPPVGAAQPAPSPAGQAAAPLPGGQIAGGQGTTTPVLPPTAGGIPASAVSGPAAAPSAALPQSGLQGTGLNASGYAPPAGGIIQGIGAPPVLQVGQFVHLTPASLPSLGTAGVGASGTGITGAGAGPTFAGTITPQGGAALPGTGLPGLTGSAGVPGPGGGQGGIQAGALSGLASTLSHASAPSMSGGVSGLLQPAPGTGAPSLSQAPVPGPGDGVSAPFQAGPSVITGASATLPAALLPEGTAATGGIQTAPQIGIATPNIRIAGQNITVDAKITGITPPQHPGSGQAAPGGIFAPSNVQPGQVTGVIGPMAAPPGGAAARMSLSLFDGGRMMAGPLLLPAGIAPMAAGTSLHLDIIQTQAVGPQGRAAGVPLPGLQGLYQSLTLADAGLGDIADFLETLASRLPAADAQAAMRIMPQIGGGNVAARFTTPVLFFLAALRGGDMAAWMGERNANILREDGKSDLLARLTRGFSALSKSFSEPVQVQGGEWRSASLPLLFGPDLTRFQFHIRDYHGRDEDDEDALDRPNRRMVIDFSLSRMGDMQIDSLIFEGRMDTMLRAEYPFSDRMRQDLRQRYTAVMRGIGYQGALDFQSGQS